MLRPAALGAVASIAIIAVGGWILVRPPTGPAAAAPSSGTVSPPPSVAAVASAPASPTPSQTAVPTPTAVPTLVPEAVFTSPWYGYQVQYPSGWNATPGQGPWPVGANLSHGDPRLDSIMGQVNGPDMARFVGASVKLPKGMTLDGFRAFASPAGQTCQADEPLPAQVKIDGVDALVSLDGCLSASELHGWIWDIVVVAGGRGYDFTVDGHLTAAEAMQLLDTVRLLPATARPPSG